ncbi:hypothetical protein AVEN_440-1 [Araneus ventricosus]|uniref:Uncharacterized protein n=1 Tax=Araneus ventricosus TaxID=182803 RepID=A0A4Y2IX37_ARAVE|nr:hypothetical protein AVEN_440-1 [Araneus ventricosus]
MNWTLSTWMAIYPTTPPPVHGKGLWLARIIGPPTALISYLPSKEATRLRPAFVAVKGKFLDRLSRCERVNVWRNELSKYHLKTQILGKKVESSFPNFQDTGR